MKETWAHFVKKKSNRKINAAVASKTKNSFCPFHHKKNVLHGLNHSAEITPKGANNIQFGAILKNKKA